jgi:hypothetical protein
MTALIPEVDGGGDMRIRMQETWAGDEDVATPFHVG